MSIFRWRHKRWRRRNSEKSLKGISNLSRFKNITSRLMREPQVRKKEKKNWTKVTIFRSAWNQRSRRRNAHNPSERMLLKLLITNASISKKNAGRSESKRSNSFTKIKPTKKSSTAIGPNNRGNMNKIKASITSTKISSTKRWEKTVNFNTSSWIWSNSVRSKNNSKRKKLTSLKRNGKIYKWRILFNASCNL